MVNCDDAFSCPLKHRLFSLYLGGAGQKRDEKLCINWKEFPNQNLTLSKS